jgi:hypothetical protein
MLPHVLTSGGRGDWTAAGVRPTKKRGYPFVVSAAISKSKYFANMLEVLDQPLVIMEWFVYNKATRAEMLPRVIQPKPSKPVVDVTKSE